MKDMVIRTAAFPLLALAALVVACGGGDGPGPTFVPGEPINCAGLTGRSFTYNVHVLFDVREPGDGNLGEPGVNSVFIDHRIEGEYEDPNSIAINGLNTDGFNDTDVGIVIDNGRAWNLSPISGWRELDVTEEESLTLLLYTPGELCQALVPDVNTAGSGESDTVNGIDAVRFDLGTVQSDFFDRIPSIGPAHDASTLVNDIDITAWVARHGGYLAKVTATGSALYIDGRTLTAIVEFEVTDADADVSIEAPV